MTRNHSAPARPRALWSAASLDRTPEDDWTLELRLVWDGSQQFGWVSGSAWSSDGSEVVELPALDVSSEDLDADVVALLHSLWSEKP